MINSARFINSDNSMIEVDFDGSLRNIPNAMKNSHRILLEEWVQSGNSISPYIQDLENLRTEKTAGIKVEGLKRIRAKVDAIDSIAVAKLIYKHMWPVPNASQALIDGEAIFTYVVGRLQAAAGATREQLEGYDPVTDPNWP